jgi:putative tricarboxylic transport membrane protein
MKKLPSVLLILFWGGLGLFAMIHSYSLGRKGITGPGPGLMPFLIGVLLILTALYMLVSSFLRKEDRVSQEGQSQGGQSKVYLWRAGLAVISLIAYALLMETLGFLITTTLLLITLFKGMGSRKWSSVVAASVLTSLITYFAFTYLRLRLPMGILWF